MEVQDKKYERRYKIVKIWNFIFVLFISCGPLLQKDLSIKRKLFGFLMNFTIYYIITYLVVIKLFVGWLIRTAKHKEEEEFR